jgi:hypothetical protein
MLLTEIIVRGIAQWPTYGRTTSLVSRFVLIAEHRFCQTRANPIERVSGLAYRADANGLGKPIQRKCAGVRQKRPE